MSAERWVATRAIQEAVKRRESDVLQAIGIPWDEGAGHTTCPYPDHADANPSWRWDARKAADPGYPRDPPGLADGSP